MGRNVCKTIFASDCGLLAVSGGEKDSTRDNYCMVKVNQSLRYVHSWLKPVILIKMSTNNPSWKSLVLESSVKPRLCCDSPVLVFQAWFDRKSYRPGLVSHD